MCPGIVEAGDVLVSVDCSEVGGLGISQVTFIFGSKVALRMNLY